MKYGNGDDDNDGTDVGVVLEKGGAVSIEL